MSFGTTLALNGAKFGCGLGQCGACTVMLNGEAVFSCLTPVLLAAGKELTTVEGLGTQDSPGPMQRAFIEEQAAQCGYCIAGMMMRAQALLRKNPSPTDADIRDCDGAEPLSLRYAYAHHAGHQARSSADEDRGRGDDGEGDAMTGMPVILSRRHVLAGAGALIVSFGTVRALAQEGSGAQDVQSGARVSPPAPLPGSLKDSPFLDSWIRIDANGAITVFTGKAELGQGHQDRAVAGSGRAARCAREIT